MDEELHDRVGLVTAAENFPQLMGFRQSCEDHMSDREMRERKLEQYPADERRWTGTIESLEKRLRGTENAIQTSTTSEISNRTEQQNLCKQNRNTKTCKN